MKRIFSIIAVALTLLVQGAAAGSIVYSLGDRSGNFGTGGKNEETYDVALLLNDPTLVGVSIKGVRIPFASTDGLEGASTVWLSKALPVIKTGKMTEPDILSMEFTPAAGFTEVLFDTPYIITGEGVYVGYSFTVEKTTTAWRPVVVTKTSTPDACYIHTNKIYRTAWRSMSTLTGDLAIEVLLEGDAIKGDDAAVGVVSDKNIRTGEPATGSFEVVNYGMNGVKSVDFTVEVAGFTQSRHVELATALPGIYSRKKNIDFEIPAIPQKGGYQLTVTLDKVNGIEITNAANKGEAKVSVYNNLPIHRPVLEEYTGTWCGWCPRGFVGLELMNKLYPDDFIGVSYHNGDPMEITTQFPSDVQGFPDAWIDRYYNTDAFVGDNSGYAFGIDKVWEKCRSVFTPAAVDVESKWIDDNTLAATSYVTFPVGAEECPYEVSFLLVQDGMTGTQSNWNQSNYYSGANEWPSEMNQFKNAGSSVSGLVFNDVLVSRSSIGGIANSMTAPIVEDVAQTYTYEFKMDKVKNTSGQNIIQDKQKLRVVVLLLNKKTGEVVNANKAQAGASSVADGISMPATADEVVSTVKYFDLQGRRVLIPSNGMYIKNEQLANGRQRNSKVYFK